MGRKVEHIKISLRKESQCTFGGVSNFFEYVELPYLSLPEINFDEIDLRTFFLGKEISAPIVVDSITGGEKISKKINIELAKAAEKERIPLFLGSLKPAISGNLSSFKLREYAPSIPIIGNIGVVNLKESGMMRKIEGILKDIEADGLAIHLNPLQEVLQIEGDKDFTGCIKTIEEACDYIDLPIIVKEVGFGISEEIAKILDKTKIEMINIAGAGGTSFSKIEIIRREIKKEINYENEYECFSYFGIPTALSLIQTLRNTKKKVICSGGIRNGLEIAKAIALGASYAGAAYPFLEAFFKRKICERIISFKNELKIAMFITGAKNIEELKRKKVKVYGKLKEMIERDQEKK